jgi:hypothetical protein
MEKQSSDVLTNFARLEEAATFFLYTAFEHAHMAAQLEVAGMLFAERIQTISPEPDWAQVLEQAFIHLAIILQVSGKTEITRKDIDSLFDKFEKQPMGHLLNEARKVGPIPTDLDTSLSSALDRRNYLTHRFFFEHSEDFISENGRSTMIQELQSITAQFQSADIELDGVVLPMFSQLGISEEKIQSAYRQMMERAKSRDVAG